ncbi:hypothetical protein J437_LFUL015958 [Ladona fulva]|uniref:Uncharacterized protein n=1 Tax=Ladona fulva TaxID=123851 RepID=A0A8K0KPJ4_LADFU|nr:hypothetical protein J437_LFUL015958 [Ladona fulva]
MSSASINIAAGMQPIGSSILKRLGIDENVDYTKPLVNQHTMNLLRGYHAYGQFGGLLTSPVQAGSFGKRERSGSESSSVSDRCGGGSVTPPDRRQKSLTPRSTPEAIQSSPVATPVTNLANSTPPTSQPATPMPEKKEEEGHETGEEEKEEKEDVDKDDTKKDDKEVEDGEVDEESQDKPSKDEDQEAAEVSPKVEEETKTEKEPVEETGKEDSKKVGDQEKEEEAQKESPKAAGSVTTTPGP